MMDGVRVLAAAPRPPSVALAFLAAQTLECLLKAYLLRSGADAPAKIKQLLRYDRDVRHNLERLWSMAHKDGLHINPTPPQWATRLAGIHDDPYHLRYPEVHAIVTPAAEPMTSDLTLLFGTVMAQLQ